MTIALLTLMTAMTMTAQTYRRPARPMQPAHQRSYYGRTYRNTFHHRPAEDVYYGLRLGLGVSTVNSNDVYLDGGSAKAGLNLGVVAGFRLAPTAPVFLETGLLYAEKGGNGSWNGKFSYAMNYLEVPMVMKYHIEVSPMTTVQPFVGVFGAVGVGGQMKDFDERHAYSSFDDDAFRRFDGGIRLGCSLQYDHLYAEIGYDAGLANVSRDYFDTAHSGSFFVNVGMNF